ncbi:MAG: flagellar hook-basal body complex protein FliE [Deltaproteobacteria bacterium]|jgi:flagellar hook-basal body complex protein FliE|nr:flagellar hook-basal body complex protein FliE [Deltaproteobacteria bacterium]
MPIPALLPAVAPLTAAVPGALTGAVAEAPRAAHYGADFAARLERAVQSVDDHERVADVRIAKVASGEDVDLHGMMIALQEADITLRLANSVREKAIDAFERIQNMQI